MHNRELLKRLNLLKMKQRKIGRGLSALLGDVTFSEIEERASSFGSTLTVRDISVNDIEPNPNQPRKNFDEEKIGELADSIRQNGILQPIIVQQNDDDDSYTIIAGERRYRAALQVGLTVIPCIVRDTHESDRFIISMIENIQRAGLNPIEEALGYQNICIKYDLSHADIARMLGKSRTHVSNMIGILSMPGEIQQMLASGELSTGHAKVLKKLSSDTEIIETASKIREQSLSVRALEKYIDDAMNLKKYGTEEQFASNSSHSIAQNAHVSGNTQANNGKKVQRFDINRIPQEVLSLEDAYNANYPYLGHIKHNQDGSGQVIIHYKNMEELRGIMSSMIDITPVYAK